MNKERYLKNLSRLIRRLPDDERERVVEFYREIIEDKMESGETEEQAVGELGDVRILAQKILSENPNRKPVNAGKTVLITLVSLFGVLIVGGITVAILGFHAMDLKAADRVRINIGNSETLFGGSADSTDYEKKTYSAKAGGVQSIVLDAENKAIEVVPSDTDEIVVDYAQSRDDAYSFSSEGGVFSMKNTENGNSRSWGFHWGDDAAVKITVKVPSSYGGDFTVNTTNSFISIGTFGHIGAVACKTQNSAISLSGLSADTVNCRTQNAAITLKNVTAGKSLSADTENAIITLDGISSPDIALETRNAIISGSVSGSRDDYTVEAGTTNAICNLQSGGSGPKKLKVETTNAIISISFR